MVWQETTLFGLCMLALFSLGTGGSFDDPSVQLWMVMLGVQSLPYLATIITAAISAMSYKSQRSTPARARHSSRNRLCRRPLRPPRLCPD